ncbi:MAG: hypothetical protein K9W43_11500 [Candidatus Thorarchaeota archaeon]|nr:hypothetical protein [Candidatus Thorarchaeota archaeon]
MAVPPPIELILFIFEQVTFISGAVLMYRTYSRYEFASHLYMIGAFLLLSFSSAMRLITSTIDPTALETAELSWSAANFFLISGIIFIFYSFFYFQYNQLPGRANIASILGGATLMAYINRDWFTVSYDSSTGMFTASYSPVVNFLVIPLIVLFIIVFLLPIVTKIRLAKNRKAKADAASLLIVLIFLLTWAAMSAFTSSPIVREFRPFFFAAGWTVWILLTFRRPLNLIFTQRRFEKLLVMTDAGYPVLMYDFKTTTLEDPSLFSALFTALQTALSDLLKADTTLRSIYYENKVVSIEKRASVSIFGIGDEPDTALMVALRAFCQQPVRDLSGSSDY